MSDKSVIEWTDATWNPITGCSVVSAGCKRCYAMKLAGTRLQHHQSRAGLTSLQACVCQSRNGRSARASPPKLNLKTLEVDFGLNRGPEINMRQYEADKSNFIEK